MKSAVIVGTLAGVLLAVSACERRGEQGAAPRTGSSGSAQTHTHADGTSHAHTAGDHDHDHDDHDHDEVELGTLAFGDMQVRLAQSHGLVAPGKEGHLVVKLPYNDGGATIVRAWLGTQDRTLSYVGRGDYAAAHDDYDIHAMAPDPLPENTMWWVEIEKPDGTKVLGSVRPLME
jgi:hypothetical protein